MISFVTTGRNDDYGNRFLDRFYLSLTNNIKNIEKFNIEYEYLVIEWSPIKKYLLYQEPFDKVFNENKNLIDVIVKSDVAFNERLEQNMFFEYFAKNVGMRLSKYDVIVLVNSDVIIPEHTMQKILEIINNGIDEKTYYRPQYRSNADYDLNELCKEDVTKPEKDFSYISGHYSGDLFFMKRESLIKYGKGYDETNYSHRIGSQTSMDTEIMYNLHRNGCKLEYLDYNYLHIDHGRPRRGSNIINSRGYENKPNWGFIDYKKRNIKSNLIEIAWL